MGRVPSTCLQDPDLLLTNSVLLPRSIRGLPPVPTVTGEAGPHTSILGLRVSRLPQIELHSQHHLQAPPLTIPMSAGGGRSPGGQSPGHQTEYCPGAQTLYRTVSILLSHLFLRIVLLLLSSTSLVGSSADGGTPGPTSGVPASQEPPPSAAPDRGRPMEFLKLPRPRLPAQPFLK